MKNNLTLYVDNQLVEMGIQTIDLRLNAVNFNPVYTKSSQAEYSFSFDIPSTPVNDKIFDYSNNLSKKNKFKRRYNAKAYVGEILIFEGHLIINSYNGKNKVYNVNIVDIKVYDANDIFGDDTLDKIKWMIDYQGAATINAANADPSSKYKFPLVAYGKFQKVPYYSDDVADDYTSNFTIDEYNRFWHNSFPPSLNVLELTKKAFEQYGYNVGGSAFDDPYLSNIFASYSIADDQDPKYNLGNTKFGQIDISGSFSTASKTYSWSQDHHFPYRKVVQTLSNNGIATDQYNYTTSNIWNIINESQPTISESPNYLYNPDECLVIIPNDGFYEISLEITNGQLQNPETTFTGYQQWMSLTYSENLVQHDIPITRNLTGETPLEIQLVKNYDNDVELIKGKNNVRWGNGNPNDLNYLYVDDEGTLRYSVNKKEWTTCYPHQEKMQSESPTDDSQITAGALGASASNGFTHHNRDRENTGSKRYYYGYGYVPTYNGIFPYDTTVSPNFLCGFSTFDGGTVSVVKNGPSWDRGNTIETEVFANVHGLDFLTKENDGTSQVIHTTYNKNTYNNAPYSFCNAASASFGGKVYMCAKLNKGDKLELLAIQRNFNETSGTTYTVSGNYHLKIRAISPSSYAKLQENPDFGYNYQTEFPVQLNLCNFCNKETKISDWITSVSDALNLEITQNGNNITINSNKSFSKRKTLGLIDIDDRVNAYISEVESKRIDFPSKFAVQWTISEDEFGFVDSAGEHIDDEDWKEYADSGYTVIKVSDDIWNKDEQTESVQFSYSWYHPYEYNLYAHDEIININVIGNDEQYIDDRHDANDSMSKDSYSATQRFWYVKQPTNITLPLASYGNESVYITTTQNNYQDFYLSYKNTEKSLLTEYFNGSFVDSSSNEVHLKDVLLSPDEYKQLKGGSMVKFDKDAYLVEKVENYSYLEQMADLTLYK